MRSVIIWIIWLALVIVSALSPLWGSESLFLSQVFARNLDPTLWFVFISLGVFPLYFFILALNDKQSLPRSLMYLLGMILGGFVIFPLEALNKAQPQPLSKFSLYLLVLLNFVLLGLLLWANFTGSWEVYMQSFRNDLFVYVMTWDAIAFIIVLKVKLFTGLKYYYK